jgi:hypothetical protein
MKRNWQETLIVQAYLKYISRNVPGRTEENHVDFSRNMLFPVGFEQDTSLMKELPLHYLTCREENMYFYFSKLLFHI